MTENQSKRSPARMTFQHLKISPLSIKTLPDIQIGWCHGWRKLSGKEEEFTSGAEPYKLSPFSGTNTTHFFSSIFSRHL